MSNAHSRIQLALTNAFEICFASISVLIAASWGIDSAHAALHSPLPNDLHHWFWTWLIPYAIGGPAVIFGILWRHPNIRAAGLVLMASGFLAEFVASLYGSLEPRSFNYLLFSLTCMLRVFLLVQVYNQYKSYET